MHITTHVVNTLFSLLPLLPLTPAHVIQERAAPIAMGRAAAFGAVAYSTITSTGSTKITGDCGVCPGTSITGFLPGKCTTTSSDGTTACNAQTDCGTAYKKAAAAGPSTTLPSSNLGGITLKPGVYTFLSAGALLTGTLKLNGAGNPDGQYIFQIGSTLTTATNAMIVLENGAQACNVYFQIGSSATIGAGSVLNGNFLALASISVDSAASNSGTFCALNGAVTLIDNALTAHTTCTT